LSLIASWVLFPIVLAAIGAGWGLAVERAAGLRPSGALVVPLGLAAAIVVASLLTAWSVTAPAATTVVAVGAVGGLIIARPVRRPALWPALMACGVLLAYGAPVLLSGSATFAGYFRLDDTATWLGITDHVMSHGRSLAGVPTSEYSARLSEYVANAYPLGSFMLLGVGHALTAIDSAWIIQPYLACCGAAVGLGVYALVEPIVGPPRLRALLAFIAAQPALLYGYSLWGGIKELTAAFLLVLGAALVAGLIAARPDSPRRLLPAAVAAAALIVTLGAGAAAWVLPALVGVVIVWVARARRAPLWGVARDVVLLAITTAVLALPMWVVLSSFLGNDSNLFTSGQPPSEKLGTLFGPLSGWQLAGIWPVGDFRLSAPTVPTTILIGLALLAAGFAIWSTVRRRQFAVAAYVAMALVGCAVYYLVGSTPWVLAKSFAIASPAVLAAALVGGVLLLPRWRVGLLVLVALGAGVVWSNVLAYRDVTLAPRPRLADLQHIGDLIARDQPTFMNETEYYAYRHFLRDGAPFQPALTDQPAPNPHQPEQLPLRNGVLLTGNAWADLDSFPLSTLESFRSIVTRRSPAESRPPSIYKLVWQGRYYQLWQRPALPSTRIIEHIPLGESNALPYCGPAKNAPSMDLCSIDPVAIPPCARIQSLARQASARHVDLVAYQRAQPIAIRGDQTTWPPEWNHNRAEGVVVATVPGAAVAEITVPSDGSYALWLKGGFTRGFDVSLDGHRLGSVENELGGWVHLADRFLTAGTHTFVLAYPQPDLAPGSGESAGTFLSAIVLQPHSPASELISVSPRQATQLCGRPLDWIELVATGTVARPPAPR
jgi:hypothetical protein